MCSHDDPCKFVLFSIELVPHSSPSGIPGMILRDILFLHHNANA